MHTVSAAVAACAGLCAEVPRLRDREQTAEGEAVAMLMTGSKATVKKALP